MDFKKLKILKHLKNHMKFKTHFRLTNYQIRLQKITKLAIPSTALLLTAFAAADFPSKNAHSSNTKSSKNPAENSFEKKPLWSDSVKENYNDRIRDFSTPSKIFYTFASVYKEGQPRWVKYMTIDDFLLSLIPRSPLAREKLEENPVNKKDYKEFFDLIDTDNDGLISFPEFILFTTFLTIPENKIETAFKMFDLDGNGKVDIDEFFNLVDVIKLEKSSINLRNASKETKILKNFFGESFEGHLIYKDFKNFIVKLRNSVSSLEFDLYKKSDSETINSTAFAETIINYCARHKISDYKKRLQSIPIELEKQQITRREFLDFNKVLGSLEDIKIALDLFSRSLKYIEKSDFERAVWTVTGVRLSKSQIDVIFFVFDQSGKGKLMKEDLFTALEFRYNKAKTFGKNTPSLSIFKCVRECFVVKD